MGDGARRDDLYKSALDLSDMSDAMNDCLSFGLG
jgi:hypothetical protein